MININFLSVGQKAVISIKDRTLTIHWKNVFDVTTDVTFLLFAGTDAGFGDLINHVVTQDLGYSGNTPNVVTSAVYVTIMAATESGEGVVYQDQFIPPSTTR